MRITLRVRIFTGPLLYTPKRHALTHAPAHTHPHTRAHASTRARKYIIHTLNQNTNARTCKHTSTHARMNTTSTQLKTYSVLSRVSAMSSCGKVVFTVSLLHAPIGSHQYSTFVSLLSIRSENTDAGEDLILLTCACVLAESVAVLKSTMLFCTIVTDQGATLYAMPL